MLVHVRESCQSPPLFFCGSRASPIIKDSARSTRTAAYLQEQSLSNPTNTPADLPTRAEREADIERFTQRHLPGENQDLYQDMLRTLCRLLRENAGRGDVKLLNKALGELRYALKVFAPYAGIHKVSMFGSSRTPEDHPDYRQAVEFARRMCENGWMVITGAGDGIMKAGHGGAGREASFGVAIRLPFEQKTNEIIADDSKLVSFRYFFTRKVVFMKEAAAVALFPGGFGTQDEGFEALVLIQTGKAPLVPIVMLEQPGGTYWPQWRAYVAAELLRTGMINEQDMNLFCITDNVETAVANIVQFYRVYHSMRYVSEELVLRLERPLSPNTLARINTEFKPILASGRIEQCGPLPAENGEFADKTRLKLHFDRQSFGLLRKMINLINHEEFGT
ncbi:MAG: LOG family protein [Planctomycetes bacterium]|nr:LOG family protein [Planctomycetota bacterium]